MAANVKGKCVAIYFAASTTGRNTTLLAKGYYEVTPTQPCYIESGDVGVIPTAPSGTAAESTCSYPLAAGQTGRIFVNDGYIGVLNQGATAGYLIIKGGQ
jgi:hypothetical protein